MACTPGSNAFTSDRGTSLRSTPSFPEMDNGAVPCSVSIGTDESWNVSPHVGVPPSPFVFKLLHRYGLGCSRLEGSAG